MYQFTNEQRRCFGLEPVDPSWQLLQLKTSHFDHHDAYVYLDGRTVKRFIMVADDLYCEYEHDAMLSDDLTLLLPKTERGKAVKLSSATMLKRSPSGMCFKYSNHNYSAYIDIYYSGNQIGYYNNSYERLGFASFSDFTAWVDRWCAGTNDEDIREIEAIKNKKRVHIKCHEGDVFRFKLTRRLYGYARIIRDYTRLEKEKIPYFRTFMGTAVLCSVYFIATEDKNVLIDRLKTLKSLPSMTLNESLLYYGEYEIVGNIPLTDDEDYPYVYGRSTDAREWHLKKMLFQNGKELLMIEGADPVPEMKDQIGYRGRPASFSCLNLDILRRCIEEDSVTPYWEDSPRVVKDDLRNPKNAEALRAIRRQFGLE